MTQGAAARSVRILLLATEPTTQRRIQLLLDRHGFLVVAAASTSDGHRLLRAESFDGVLVDGAADPELGVIEAYSSSTRTPSLATAQAAVDPLGVEPPLPVLVVLDTADAEQVDRALAAGAADVVDRRLLDAMLVHRLRSVLRASGRNRSLAPAPARQAGTRGVLRRAGRRKTDVLIGRSSDMLALADQIDMIAKTDLGVAIFGETGTGKELVARTLHALSARSGKPYVVANCTALPEALFENELFGHERGAFTGADSRQEGLLREAEHGTLVLDEIGDLYAGVQAKLLRLLQFHEYKMIGGTKTLHADVRILTTTHRDLARAVADKRFREDLYYRLNTLHITLPPLRDRLEDIPLLVDHFVSLFNEREGRDFVGFTPAALRALQQHHWPGNVRELESVVYRSLVMAGTRKLLDADALQAPQAVETGAVDLDRPFAELKSETLERFERRYLEALLRHTRGNLSEAARAAQHERKSLWRLLRKYEIDAEAYRQG